MKTYIDAGGICKQIPLTQEQANTMTDDDTQAEALEILKELHGEVLEILKELHRRDIQNQEWMLSHHDIETV
jgi:hypothetical protein